MLHATLKRSPTHPDLAKAQINWPAFKAKIQECIIADAVATATAKMKALNTPSAGIESSSSCEAVFMELT